MKTGYINIGAAALCLFTALSTQASALKNEYTLMSNTGIPTAPVRVPEGIAFDELTQDFYATSIFGGKITRIDGKTGNETVFYQETQNPFQSFAGIKIDVIRRLAWVCVTDLVSVPGTPQGQVYSFFINPNGTGTVLKKFNLPAPFFCNDVALDAEGSAYATNSLGASIYKMTLLDLILPSGTAHAFATSPLFLPDFTASIVLGQNGLAFTPDQKYLILARSVPAALFRISRTNPSDIQQITFTGDAFSTNPDPHGDPVLFLGPDGLIFVQNKLYVSFHGGVQQLTFNSQYTVANVKSTTQVPTGLSTDANANGQLYVVSSQIVPVTEPQLNLPVILPHKIVKVPFSAFH